MILGKGEEEFLNFEKKANGLCGSKVYKKDTKRVMTQNVLFGESKEEHTEFDGRKSFIIINVFRLINVL